MLSALDSHQLIRESAFALLLTHAAPVALADLERVTGLGDGLPMALDELAGLGWIDRDEAGRITGSAGLSLSSGPHRLELRGVQYRTWCAYDAIGIVAALGEDATVATACPVCDAAIVLPLKAGRPHVTRSERLFLAVGGADLRIAWSDQQGSAGSILTLEAAADLGAAAWATCAAASRAVDP